jgi:hypothetical protein
VIGGVRLDGIGALMGQVISIQEAYRARRRRRESQINARCRVLIADSLERWRDAGSVAGTGAAPVRRRRVLMLGDLLAYADLLP